MLKRDFKYILKRIIIGTGIALLCANLSSCKVKAYDLIQTYPIPNYSSPYVKTSDIGVVSGQLNAFPGYGKGYIYFTFVLEQFNPSAGNMELLSVKLINTNNQSFTCNVGTASYYKDANPGAITYSSTCPVDLSNYGVKYIAWYFTRENANAFQQAVIYMSDIMTFVSDSTYYGKFNEVLDQLYYLRSQGIDLINTIQVTNSNLNDIKNKLDTLITAVNGNKQATEEINQAINDDTIDNQNVTNQTQGWEQQGSYVPTGSSGGSLTDLLTIPLKLIQGIVNGLGSSCVPFNLGTLFDTPLILPCIDIPSIIGQSLWVTIDILMSGFMIYTIAKKFIRIFNDFTNLKSNQIDDIYGGGV